MPCWIEIYNGIITTIGKHISTEEGLAGTAIGVGVYESGDSGVIISGLQIVEAGFDIVMVAPIAEGVTVCEVGGVGQDCAGCIPDSFHLAPLVILVGRDQPGRFHGNEIHCHHVALQILGEQVIFPIAVGEIRIVGTETNNVPGFVKGIPHGEVFAAVGVVPPFRYRLTVYNKIIHRRAVGVHLPGAQTVGVVLVPGGFRAAFGGGKLPAVAPGERPVGTVEIGQGIADLVIGKGAGICYTLSIGRSSNYQVAEILHSGCF